MIDSNPPVLPVFVPDWTLPPGVKALQTGRGVGPAPYGGFNLGDHVGDVSARVEGHRQQLRARIGATPVWMRQVHGTHVLDLDEPPMTTPEADAAMSRQPGVACTVMTADCLPVLIADRQARVVGAAHAGWRGLAAGVLENLVGQMIRVPGVSPQSLSVWLGPAIGPDAFEVGPDVVDAFVHRNVAYHRCFQPHPESHGKYLADLAELATQTLHAQGIEAITGSQLCTMTLADRFYSYRRDGVTGRMASLIWLETH